MDITWKKEEKNYITAFAFDSMEKYLCISLSPVLSFWAHFFLKFGICQVGVQRESRQALSPFVLSSSVCLVKMNLRQSDTAAHIAKAF